ncbi:MAG: prepilin-type N-terminal cleavage/methylation domain-containing protein [Candidatus Omnitrophica bacterium]|nr:prepilin-type N-terminal cleavage/methylation domain-containing protein [Candidatus Omnitrophota bacterium]
MVKKNFTTGFSFIELLITLAILGLLFVPVMQLFSHSLYCTASCQELITATNLAKWEMERIKNLNFTKEQLKKTGSLVYPPLDEAPLEMNKLCWRIKREVIVNSDPVEVRVSVFRQEKQDEPIIVLVTLIEDMTWTEIRPVN